MEQALLNILKNAIEAIDGDGTVTIGVTAAGGRTTLTIDDTGPGISAEAQANLFTPFFSTKPHGQGIGLTLVQEILTGHGFDYGIERTPAGTTRFTIVLQTNPKIQAPSSNHSQLPHPKANSQLPNPNDAQASTRT